jgi:hypothetical protein
MFYAVQDLQNAMLSMVKRAPDGISCLQSQSRSFDPSMPRSCEPEAHPALQRIAVLIHVRVQEPISMQTAETGTSGKHIL